MIGHEEANVSKAVSAGMETNGTISDLIFSTHLLFLCILIIFANVTIHELMGVCMYVYICGRMCAFGFIP
jgi:hypothetical protein